MALLELLALRWALVVQEALEKLVALLHRLTLRAPKELYRVLRSLEPFPEDAALQAVRGWGWRSADKIETL